MPKRSAKTQPEEITVLFAGSGPSTDANTKELLDEWLPDDVADVVIEKKIAAGNTSLKGVRKFLAAEFKEDGITQVPDMLSYIKGLDNQPDEVIYLVLLWNDDDESRELLEAADSQGIIVKDLTDGLDKIIFEADEPEEEKEPPARTKRRSRTARAADKAEEDAEATPAPGLGTRTSGTTKTVTHDLSAVTAVNLLPENTWTLEELVTVIDARLALHLHDLASKITERHQTGKPVLPTDPTGEEAPHGRARRTGADGLSKVSDEEKFTFILDEDGQVIRKRGRGKPRANQETAELTLAEAREKGYEE